jgi:hypothetical protein
LKVLSKYIAKSSRYIQHAVQVGLEIRIGANIDDYYLNLGSIKEFYESHYHSILHSYDSNFVPMQHLFGSQNILFHFQQLIDYVKQLRSMQSKMKYNLEIN